MIICQMNAVRHTPNKKGHMGCSPCVFARRLIVKKRQGLLVKFAQPYHLFYLYTRQQKTAQSLMLRAVELVVSRRLVEEVGDASR